MAGIEIRNLHKRFGDTVALDGLDLTVPAGEIFGIAGPNGAGKSTLIKVLAAEETADAGEITIDDEPWSPASAHRKIAVVHQEPQLFPNLTVGQNLLVGRETGKLDRPHVTERERSLLRQLDIAQYIGMPVESCSLAVKQRTEIAHALTREARCILFDEPNSALTDEESLALFRLMRSLADAGHIIILVSHRLADLVGQPVRVAIIRDGRCPVVLEGETLTQENIAAELVVGRARQGDTKAEAAAGERKDLLELRDWTHRGKAFRNINLDVAAGEIVALVGVEGSGARQLLQSLAGYEPAKGQVKIGDRSGERAVRTYAAYVAPDRRESLFSNLSVGENIVSRLGRSKIARFAGSFERRRAMVMASKFVHDFSIRTRSTSQAIGSVSGGNQQKAAIAAAVIVRPPLLMLEEPTRGVDIASKAEIYRILREYAVAGNALLIYCTEVPEVFEAADRAYVISNGMLSPPLEIKEFADVESLAKKIASLERHAQLARTA